MGIYGVRIQMQLYEQFPPDEQKKNWDQVSDGRTSHYPSRLPWLAGQKAKKKQRSDGWRVGAGCAEDDGATAGRTI